MKKFMMLFLTLSIVVILTACGGDSAEKEKDKDKEGESDKAPEQEVQISEEEKIDEDKVVVSINGTEIKGDKYNVMYIQTKMQTSQSGQEDVDLEQLKEHTIDSLVARELVSQEAQKEGVDVTEEDVKTEFDMIKSQNEEGLASLLEQFQLTEEGFKEQLLIDLTMDQYVKEVVDIEITDEEIKDYYAQVKEQSEDVPELKEVEEQIKAGIEQQKLGQEINTIVEKLKKTADIEKMI